MKKSQIEIRKHIQSLYEVAELVGKKKRKNIYKAIKALNNVLCLGRE